MGYSYQNLFVWRSTSTRFSSPSQVYAPTLDNRSAATSLPFYEGSTPPEALITAFSVANALAFFSPESPVALPQLFFRVNTAPWAGPPPPRSPSLVTRITTAPLSSAPPVGRPSGVATHSLTTLSFSSPARVHAPYHRLTELERLLTMAHRGG